jgi:hypothetical protein
MFDRIREVRRDLTRRGSTYFAIGKDIFDYGRDVIKERLIDKTAGDNQEDIEHKLNEEKPTISHEAQAEHDEDEELKEKRRQKLQKNFTVPEANNPLEQSKQQSMKDSQGVADHSGSSYHGPGRPGDKSNSNMWQQNFDNHQGN